MVFDCCVDHDGVASCCCEVILQETYQTQINTQMISINTQTWFAINRRLCILIKSSVLFLLPSSKNVKSLYYWRQREHSYKVHMTNNSNIKSQNNIARQQQQHYHICYRCCLLWRWCCCCFMWQRIDWFWCEQSSQQQQQQQLATPCLSSQQSTPSASAQTTTPTTSHHLKWTATYGIAGSPSDRVFSILLRYPVLLPAIKCPNAARDFFELVFISINPCFLSLCNGTLSNALHTKR